MSYKAGFPLICVIVLAIIVAGCTTPNEPLPETSPTATPAATTPTVTFAPPSSPLIGTWTLISAMAGMGVSNVIPGTLITATFAEDGTVSGTGGCNHYVASYRSQMDQISIGTVVLTSLSCTTPAGIMNQEQIALANLQGASHYSVSGDILSIADASGKTVLTFRKEGSSTIPVPFANISWRLETYKGGEGSTIGVNPATSVTVLFGADGNLTGSAGCNSYRGSYLQTGINGIRIGSLATTKMACGEPSVMDQEATYLANLHDTASYEVTQDGKLHLLDAKGTELIVYSG